MSQPFPAGFLVNHWTPLPDWHPERSLLACYLTLEDQYHVHAVVDAYQEPLADVPQLDLIQRRWLHATIQGIAFVDTLPMGGVDEVAAGLAPRLAALRAPTVVVERPYVGASGVYLPLTPADDLARVRSAIRDAAEGTLGIPEPYALPGQDSAFAPHVSIAYANDVVDGEPIRQRLDAVDGEPVMATFGRLTVLALRRVDRTWQWRDEVQLPIGATRPSGRRKRLAPAAVRIG